MKKYLNATIITGVSFITVLIFTNLCYAQTQTAKPATAPSADKTRVQPKVAPIERQFYKEMPLSKINVKSVPICKNIFNKACGQEDFPGAQNFTICLNEKFKTFKQNPDCSNLAHALIHTGFLAITPQFIPQCLVFFEKCREDLKKNRTKHGPLVCVANDPLLPPGCTILVTAALTYRREMAKIYDARLLIE